MRVIANKVLVRPLNNDEKDNYTTESGIIVKDSSRFKGRYIRAEVLGVGSGIRTSSGVIPMSDITKVGDIVLYYMPSATKVMYNGEELYVVRAEDIDAIIEPAEEVI